MTSRRHLVVYNPTAAQGKAAERIPETEALLSEKGIDYELRVTQRVWHGAELARDAGNEGYSVVVAAGGDGTVNEVVNGLMLARDRGEEIPAMGVLSIGRGNDFSYGADVPGSLADCVEVLAAGCDRPIDIGKVSGGDYPQGRYFANGIGIGFDTIVGLEAAKLKYVHGFMAYVIGAIKTFVIYPDAPELRIQHDRGIIEKASHQMSIMNGKRMEAPSSWRPSRTTATASSTIAWRVASRDATWPPSSSATPRGRRRGTTRSRPAVQCASRSPR